MKRGLILALCALLCMLILGCAAAQQPAPTPTPDPFLEVKERLSTYEYTLLKVTTLSPNSVRAQMYSANDGPLYATGAITAEFGMTLRKWLTLSLTASATGLWMERYDSYSMDLIGRRNGLTFNLMPQIRLNWVSRPSFKMYSSLGLGMAVCAFAGQTVVSDAFMIVPLGMSIGRRFFFFWETGTGNYNSFTGMNAGFGYRF